MRLDDFEAVYALVKKREGLAAFVAEATRALARVDEELAGYGVDLAPMPIAAPAVTIPPISAQTFGGSQVARQDPNVTAQNETLGEKAARLIEERPVDQAPGPAPVWLTPDTLEPIMQASGPRLGG